MILQRVELLFDHAAHFSLDERVVWHCVAHEPALYLADVPRGLAVEPSLG